MTEPHNPWGEPPYQPPQPAYVPPQPPAPPQGWAQYPGYPPQYPQGPGQWHSAPNHQRTNGMAIASMVLGILWLWWIGSVLALVFGYVAKSQIRDRNELGGGMATAGIVLGWVGVGLFALFVVFGVIGASLGA